mgnify:FL=1
MSECKFDTIEILLRRMGLSRGKTNKMLRDIIREDNNRIVAGIESVFEDAEPLPTNFLDPKNQIDAAIIAWRIARRAEREDYYRRINHSIALVPRHRKADRQRTRHDDSYELKPNQKSAILEIKQRIAKRNKQ